MPTTDTSSVAAALSNPQITVLELDTIGPIGRLGEWLFAAGASLKTYRPWKGEALPAPEELGEGLVVLGGRQNAYADAEYPWIEGVRELIRYGRTADLPTMGICLGAQIAATALGGEVAVPYERDEHGVIELQLTEAGQEDATLKPAIDEAVRAAVRAGISTSDGTRLPAYASHNDAVTRLPEGATLLATSEASPIHAWHLGRVLAFQQHPELSPAHLAVLSQRAELARRGATELLGDHGALAEGAQLPQDVVELGEHIEADAERVDPVIQSFGRTLALEMVQRAKAYAVQRG